MAQEERTLDIIQQELGEWAEIQFGKRRTDDLRIVGASEELGELVTQQLEQIIPILHIVRKLGNLSHSHLKEKCGIRGTPEEHQAKCKDAIGDISLFIMDYCNLRGWNYWKILQETWDEVKTRDWIDDPEHGGMKKYISVQENGK